LAGCKLHTFPDIDGNVSSITTLDLSWNSFPDATKIASLLTLASNVIHLDLSYCSMYGPIPHSLGKLSSLKKLDLSGNKLNESIPESLSQLLQLEILDLSNNSLQGFVPRLHRLCNLRVLNLSKNKLVGDLNGMREGQPRCNKYSLEELDLSLNRLTGSLPDWIGQSRKLKTLDLSCNTLDGYFPETLGQLSELVCLNVGFNSLQGVVSDTLFSNMTKLEELRLSWNLLNFTTSAAWVPPFQLKIIDLVSCKMGPQFPSWLRTQWKIFYLDISNARISGEIPNWFWNASSGAEYLNISNNLMSGKIPASLKFLSARMVDLSSNQFHGRLPHLNSSVKYIFLHENLFSGDLRPILTKTMGELNIVSLSGNLLSGEIPLDICNLRYLGIFDISHNNISGEIPECQINPISSLVIVNLASNYLHGSIPQWMAASQLEVLRLDSNSIHGEIPYFLKDCTDMIILDLAGNKLTGNIPSWIGENLSSLKFLRLRSNMLTGTIPPQLAYLTSLQVLDLAQNDLSGIIPSSFKNFTAMSQLNRTVEDIIDNYNQTVLIIVTRKCLEQVLDVVVKGRLLEYTKTLSLVMVLDLSCNRLSGKIPTELMDLIGLQSLNLSRNQLTGKIPDNFHGTAQLEALDLSRNHLSGSIPRSITLLSSLSNLNLSYNNLSGRIPSGNQLRTLIDRSIYVGNYDLCGFPLPNCSGDGPSEVPVQDAGAEDENDNSDLSELYISMSLGYVVGLWGICGTFLLKKSWRVAYFRFFDDMSNKFIQAKERLRRQIMLVNQG